MYFVRTPKIVKWLYPGIVWDIPGDDHKVYLTFDDGPHPEITLWILEQLKKYNAKATFFCLGENAEKYPDILKRISEEGHATGNHGYAHLDGWKISRERYLENILHGKNILHTNLFRPPYGKMKMHSWFTVNSEQITVNFSLMPGDFDQKISSEKCYTNLSKNIKGGDIVCLHDNEKAWKHLQYCLPKWLEFLSGKFLLSTLR